MITGDDQWETVRLSPSGDEQCVQISISGTFVATVRAQIKRPSESSWRDLKNDGTSITWTGATEFLLQFVGDWDVRVGCDTGDYTSGTVNVGLITAKVTDAGGGHVAGITGLAGSISTSVNVKDASNTTINPATEETLTDGSQVTQITDGVETALVTPAGALMVDTGLSDGLTDAELRASPVPVSGTVSIQEPLGIDDNGGSITVDGPITDTELRAADVNVSLDGENVAVTAAATDALLNDFVEGRTRVKKKFEFIPTSAAPTTIYGGVAAVGTATSAASWTIFKVTLTTTNIDIVWTAEEAAVWDDRATETYT